MVDTRRTAGADWSEGMIHIKLTDEQAGQVRLALEQRVRSSGFGTYEHDTCKAVLSLMNASTAEPVNGKKIVIREGSGY